MNKGTKSGMIIFLLGLILLLFYGFYQGFQRISLENIYYIGTGLVTIIILGIVILFISVLIEQQKEKKKMKNEIKKEDLEP